MNAERWMDAELTALARWCAYHQIHQPDHNTTWQDWQHPQVVAVALADLPAFIQRIAKWIEADQRSDPSFAHPADCGVCARLGNVAGAPHSEQTANV